MPLWETPGFPPKIRLVSTTNTIPVPDPGNYRAFNFIQSSIITLAHSDEPYRQNYGNSWKPPFHEREHESKIRLLKTPSHTSERQGSEAGKARKNMKGRPNLKRCRKRSSRRTIATSPAMGGRRARCMEKRKMNIESENKNKTEDVTNHTENPAYNPGNVPCAKNGCPVPKMTRSNLQSTPNDLILQLFAISKTPTTMGFAAGEMLQLEGNNLTTHSGPFMNGGNMGIVSDQRFRVSGPSTFNNWVVCLHLC